MVCELTSGCISVVYMFSWVGIGQDMESAAGGEGWWGFVKLCVVSCWPRVDLKRVCTGWVGSAGGTVLAEATGCGQWHFSREDMSPLQNGTELAEILVLYHILLGYSQVMAEAIGVSMNHKICFG